MKFYLQENEPDKEEVNVLAEFINVTTDSTQNREEKSKQCVTNHHEKMKHGELQVWKS